MSRLTIPIVCLILVGLALIHGSGVCEGLKQQAASKHKRPEQTMNGQPGVDLDLYELTPDIENQMEQAQRLSLLESADDRMFEAEDGGAHAAGVAQNERNPSGDQWFNRLRKSGKSRSRFTPTKTIDTYGARYNGDKDDNLAYSLPFDYDQEASARGSMWPQPLVRDLLIAQGDRKRSRRMDKIKSFMGRQKGQSGGGDGAADDASAGSRFYRPYRAKCAHDKTLYLTNPTFCSTNDFLGATEYGRGEIWDAIG